MQSVTANLTLTNDRGAIFGTPVRSRVVPEFLASHDVVIMELPQWLVDDLELEARVAWREPDHDVIRFSLVVELFGRQTLATARLGKGPAVVLDRLAMMMLGLQLDADSGELKVLPEPYLRT